MGLTRDDSIRRHAELRCEFARAVAVAKALPFVDTLRDFTDLHRRTTGHQAGKSPAADEMWAKLVAQIATTDDRTMQLDRIVAFMAASNLHPYDSSNSPYWPFRYDYNDADGSLRMHFGSIRFFRADERQQPGLLSSARLPELRDSLRRMFTEIAQRYPSARQVRGGSWLYNWEAYRRLYQRRSLTAARSAVLASPADRDGASFILGAATCTHRCATSFAIVSHTSILTILAQRFRYRRCRCKRR